MHALLTGRPGQADRRLVVDLAPSYGLVGKRLSMTVRIEDTEAPPGARARLTLRRDGEPIQETMAPIGVDHRLDFFVEPGLSVFELEVAAAARELSIENNRAAVSINGVRDRMRVLLVSGEPHAGERTWRNLLKSDPSVDLVHFTILRPPEKQDGTPINELSLIAFPIRQLFEVKLDEFDLVIFDRYRRRGVLPRAYLGNIAKYVRRGGALAGSGGANLRHPIEPVSHALGRGAAGRANRHGHRARLCAGGDRARPAPPGDRDPSR